MSNLEKIEELKKYKEMILYMKENNNVERVNMTNDKDLTKAKVKVKKLVRN